MTKYCAMCICAYMCVVVCKFWHGAYMWQRGGCSANFVIQSIGESNGMDLANSCLTINLAVTSLM